MQSTSKGMANALVKKIIVKRFRSIPFGEVDFSNPTFLVGQNGSGKSNFADLFAFLSEIMQSPLQAVFDRRGGIATVRNKSSGKGYPPNLGIAVYFGSINGNVKEAFYAFEVRALENYGFEVVGEQCEVVNNKDERFWFNRKKDKFMTSASLVGLQPALEPSALCMPLVGGNERFSSVVKAMAGMKVYSIQPSKLREMQDPDSGFSLRSDGSNAASVLQEIERQSKDDVDRLCEILSSIVPNTVSIKTQKHGNKLSIKFIQKWSEKNELTFEAFNMSDGTLRVVGLLMAVYQKPSPTLLVIEEPESTIHPGALGAILGLIRHASRNMQVIVTTHSPELLDAADWIEDKNLKVVTWEKGASIVAELSEEPRIALKKHLMGPGQLLRINALTPQSHEIFKDLNDQMPLLKDLK